MLGNDSFVWCCFWKCCVQEVFGNAELWCTGSFSRRNCRLLAGGILLEPDLPFSGARVETSLLFPSYFRKTWGTILLAVCLDLRRETSVFGPCFFVQKHKTLYDDYMCRHCPDTAIHDTTSLLVSVSSLDSRWFSFSAGSVPWHLGMRASQRWASRLHSPCTAMVERSCEALRAALDVKCITLPGMAAAGCRGFLLREGCESHQRWLLYLLANSSRF